MDLPSTTQDAFWARVGEIEDSALKQIKESEVFRKGVLTFEDIAEEEDSDANESSTLRPAKQGVDKKVRADSTRSNRIGDPGFGNFNALDEDRSDSSEDDHERKWDSKMRMRSRLGADMLQNKSKYL